MRMAKKKMSLKISKYDIYLNELLEKKVKKDKKKQQLYFTFTRYSWHYNARIQSFHEIFQFGITRMLAVRNSKYNNIRGDIRWTQ